MLVSFSVGNAFSFDAVQTLHMEAVSNRKDDGLLNNVHETTGPAKERLLESALIFGANASGKSNLIKSLFLMHNIILRSQSTLDEEELPAAQLIPFLLSVPNLKKPSVMEVVFYNNNIRYRYGFEIFESEIIKEWFFYTPKNRETPLFERQGQSVEFNREGFSEAKDFVSYSDVKKTKGEVKKTRTNVPFVSVLASVNGQHALNLVSFFNKLAFVSGVEEFTYINFTQKLIEKDSEFKEWLVSILNNFQIADVDLTEVTVKINQSSNQDADLASSWFDKQARTIKRKEIVLLKPVRNLGEVTYARFPLGLESEGTKKLIHLLGPIYDAIKNKRILLVDEFEAKFHTLLSKFIFKVFHEKNEKGGQIIAAVHDTNLMDTRYFRRDQIWLVNKNVDGASELYSLVEFKEKARQLKENYSSEYLQGAFGAVTLFENKEELERVM